MHRRSLIWFTLAGLSALGLLPGALAPSFAAAAGATVDVEIRNFAFVPQEVRINQGDTVRWLNRDGVTHTATGTGWNAGSVTGNTPATMKFDLPGRYNYFCIPHSDMLGVVVVQAVVAPAPPVQTAPPAGAMLPNFQPLLLWQNPPGTTQVQVQVAPFANDGPGVDLHIGSATESMGVPPPPQWYGLLPGMTYTWRVRASNAATFVPVEDPSWGAWSEATFRTPAASSDTITPVEPLNAASVSGFTPSLTWANNQKEVFYYELQLSKDPTFNTDPATATAPIYSALLHGGVTTPGNSYKVPANAPLQQGTLYYWRVRPRVQGDGTPVAWSKTFTFNTRAQSG